MKLSKKCSLLHSVEKEYWVLKYCNSSSAGEQSHFLRLCLYVSQRNTNVLDYTKEIVLALCFTENRWDWTLVLRAIETTKQAPCQKHRRKYTL